MKIRCAYCREPFEPSPSQLKELSPYGSRYCSHACKCWAQERYRETLNPRPLVPEDLYTGGQEVHLRVARKRDLRKLLRVIADVDCKLVRIRPTMKDKPWSLQRDRPPPRSWRAWPRSAASTHRSPRSSLTCSVASAPATIASST
jgi:hypothetical protein